jgi:hypothetical protein
MRGIIGKLTGIGLATIAFGSASAAFALDAPTLRCDAAIARGESRFFGGLAQCREKADRRGGSLSADDQARCTNRCERRLANVFAGPRCAGIAVERSTAEDVTGSTAATLRCRATASALAGRLSSCLADCAEIAAASQLRGFPYDLELCVDACAANDAAAVALAAARTGCDLDGETVE